MCIFPKRLAKKLRCPVCKKKGRPLPLCDGDTVEGEECHLDKDYIHFSCWCGYVFAKQLYSEFTERAELMPARFGTGITCLNYPTKDLQGGILPPIRDDYTHVVSIITKIQRLETFAKGRR